MFSDSLLGQRIPIFDVRTGIPVDRKLRLSMDYVALGKRVRAQRKLSRLTQDQLSEAAGISLSFLGHIERGTRKASIETLVAIANALKISTDLLLQDSLDEDLVGGFSSELSPDKQTLLREIANVIRDYSTDD